ncbi:helicase C-terminal domain-containing protein [Lentilactobacillus sp. Marseille-Q4993]|uniref:helicase C-terminal domain-containing protein n=1 Tax=Lentilactobacillus sp. Marseille-Q4993 TaxID=3039492 RepID=UPI0024BCD7F8|nr:helicase C-terminal domain-containing protein [Lentilactobacillus sp. Marseille-Q4993]
MNVNSVYSVVDMETTGTDAAGDDRVIQFSGFKVQNSKIIDSFTTDINPNRDIPSRIEQLTGIHKQRVADAPTMDMVANKIYSFLKGTVFVAHNVNFDFPFLNVELARAGYPELENEAVDTVTLSQLLLPTQNSYRLADLSSYFNIDHEHPHSADGDAMATAKLLIVLLRQIEGLPSITLHQVVNLRPNLPKDTLKVFQMFDDLNADKATAKRLPGHLMLVDGIVLRKKVPMTATGDQNADHQFPKTAADKQKVLPSNFESRRQQNTMMNLIFNNYDRKELDDTKSVIVEAPTGIGKSLGYSLPLAYLKEPDRKVIISTSTNYLQDQLQNQTIPLLNQVLPFKITSQILKGSSHYLDLARFKDAFTSGTGTTHDAFLIAQLLIWLTITTTGDLDELHLNIDQNSMIERIQHRGIQTINPSSEFARDDFLQFNLNNAKNADFIIVNHNYLLKHLDFLHEKLGGYYLCIDESHQFTDTVIRENKLEVSVHQIQVELDRMTTTLHSRAFKSIVQINAVIKKTVNSILAVKHEITTELNNFNANLLRYGFGTTKKAQLLLDSGEMEMLAPVFQGTRSKIVKMTQQLTDHALRLETEFRNNPELMTTSEIKQTIDTYAEISNCIELLERLTRIEQLMTDEYEEHVFWLERPDSQQVKVSCGLFDTGNYLKQTVYKSFPRPIYTGATIFSSKKSKYVFDSLGLTRNEVVSRRLKTDFDFKDNSRLYLVNSFTDANRLGNDDYYKFLAESIVRIYKNSPRQMMILFNSLDAISQTYSFMSEVGFTQTHNVLAQGVNGTANKISRLFNQQQPSLLMGTGTFWSGVDFPGDKLENLIIAQLPFDVPTEPYNRAMASRQRKNGKNPFYSVSLPNATLRMRQGIGRLIRTNDDYGTVFVLDPRLVQRHYGEIMLRNLEEYPQLKGDLDECIVDMLSFFEKH